MRQKWNPSRGVALIGGAAVILLFALVAYWPSLRGDFIWDDQQLIAQNPLIQAPDGILRLWNFTALPDYHVLTLTSFWLEWRLWGMHPTAYHGLNVLLHGINSVLLWIVLRRLGVPGAWFAGLLFAVHPVNVASVAWISERKNTLSMLFYLFAILSYLRFEAGGKRRWYGIALFAFLLALLGKPSVVMLPMVLLGCAWWQRNQITRRDWLRSVPFLVLSVVLGMVTIGFHYRAVGHGIVEPGGFIARLLLASWAIAFYLYKALIPVHLSAVYPAWNIDSSSVLSYLPVIFLAGLFAWFWRNRDGWGRPVLFAVGYFVVTLFPVLGFFDISYMVYSYVAERWQYVSIIGVIALVAGAAGTSVHHQDRVVRDLVRGVACVIVGAFTFLTWQHCHAYESNETLWRDTIAKYPDVAIAHNNLGVTLAEQGKIGEAVVQYREAVRLRPDDPDAHNNLGVALAAQGSIGEATEHYREALRIEPNDADAHCNLALVLASQGSLEEAISHCLAVLRIDPSHKKAMQILGLIRNNLGVMLAARGRLEDAAAQYQESLRLIPQYAEAHHNLGLVLVAQGKSEEAIREYVKALQYKPDYPKAHYDLGVVLADRGRTGDAIREYRESLRLNPDSPEALNRLAWTLSTQPLPEFRNGTEAVQLARRACELTRSQLPACLDTLAAAYAEAGRFADAVATAEKARELAVSKGQNRLADGIKARAGLYTAGQPCRQTASQ